MECVKCVCVDSDWGEWVRGLGLGFTNHVGKGEVWDVCLGCGGLGDWWVALLRVWEGVVVLCLCVCCESGLFCVDGRSRYLCIVLGGYLHVLCAPSVQSCCTLSISSS